MSLPERVGRYRILGFLASGGMAEILLAKLLGPGGFERAVVLKRVLPHLARQVEFRDMFLDEARIVARIRHPNVVDVSELGQEGRELFLVMEYLAGESVNGLMRRLGTKGDGARVDPALAAYVMAEAAAGLHAAHELRDENNEPLHVVHRDVSPQNIFLTYDGAVKLLDFGIAKFMDRSVETHTGQVKGKFAYMSPEQCCAERLDRRSDVFSLGILLWELATGERLFQRPNELLVWKAIVEEPIPKPNERLASIGAPAIPEALERAIMKALERNKDARYASAADLRRDLIAVLRELDPEQRGGERLAELMRAVFPDRIQQKEEMLRRVRAGDVITSVPSAEVDVQLDILVEAEEPDTAANDVRIPVTRSRDAVRVQPPVDTDPSASQPAGTAARRTFEPSWRALLFGSMLLAAVVVGAVLGIGWDRGGAEAAPPVAGTPTRLPTAPVTPPATPSVPTTATTDDDATRTLAPIVIDAPTTVRVHVETTPAGAAVVVEGEPRGVTPLALELPRGDAPLELAIRLDGHRDHVERIVPDVEQRIRLTLERDRRRGGGGTRPTKAGTESTGEGGGFFRFE